MPQAPPFVSSAVALGTENAVVGCGDSRTDAGSSHSLLVLALYGPLARTLRSRTPYKYSVTIVVSGTAVKYMASRENDFEERKEAVFINLSIRCTSHSPKPLDPGSVHKHTGSV